MSVGCYSPVVFVAKSDANMVQMSFCVSPRDSVPLATFFFTPMELVRFRNAIVAVLDRCEPVEVVGE